MAHFLIGDPKKLQTEGRDCAALLLFSITPTVPALNGCSADVCQANRLPHQKQPPDKEQFPFSEQEKRRVQRYVPCASDLKMCGCRCAEGAGGEGVLVDILVPAYTSRIGFFSIALPSLCSKVPPGPGLGLLLWVISGPWSQHHLYSKDDQTPISSSNSQ